MSSQRKRIFHFHSRSFDSRVESFLASERESNSSIFCPQKPSDCSKPSGHALLKMNASENRQPFAYDNCLSDFSLMRTYPMYSEKGDDIQKHSYSNADFSLGLASLSLTDSPRSTLNPAILSKSSTQSSEALEKEGGLKCSYYDDISSDGTFCDCQPSSSTLSQDSIVEKLKNFEKQENCRTHCKDTFRKKCEEKNFKNYIDDFFPHYPESSSSYKPRKCSDAEARGHKAMEDREYKTAVEAYTEALMIPSNNTASLLSCRSGAHHRLGLYKEALEDGQKAAKLRPLWSKAYYRVGLAYNSLGYKSSALYAFKQAIALDSNLNPKLHALCNKAEAVISKMSEVVSLRNGKDSLCCVAFRPKLNLASVTDNFRTAGNRTVGDANLSLPVDYIATGSVNGDVILWNSTSWKNSQVLSEHSGQITHLLWSKDGLILACASMDLTISLWKQNPPKRFSQDSFSSFMDSMKSVEDKPLHLHWLLSGHSASITSICFTEDSSCLVTASSDKSARLWDVATGVLLSVFTDHSSSLSRVVISPDDELVASTSEDGTVIVREISSGECLHSIDCESGTMTSCQFISCSNLPDDKPSVQFLAVCHVDGESQEGSVLLFYLENGYIWECEDCVVKFNGPVERVEICKSEGENGSLFVAISCSDGSVNLWNLRNGSFLMRLKNAIIKTPLSDDSASVVSTLAFSPCGKYLAGCAKDGRAYVWNLCSGNLVNVFLGGLNSWHNTLSWSSDSNLLSVGNGAQTIKIWRVDEEASPA